MCVCERERERERGREGERERARQPDFPDINDLTGFSFLLLNVTVNIVNMSQPRERLFVFVFMNKTLNVSCY